MKYELQHSDSIQLYEKDSVVFDVEHDVSWLDAFWRVIGLRNHVKSQIKFAAERIYISAGGHPTVILKLEDTSGPDSITESDGKV